MGLQSAFISLYLNRTPRRLLCSFFVYFINKTTTTKKEYTTKITYLEVDIKRKANTAEPIRPIDFVNEVHIIFICDIGRFYSVLIIDRPTQYQKKRNY